MLRKFKAALDQTTRPRQADLWAGMAARMLDVAAVAIVDADRPDQVVAISEGGQALTADILGKAVRVGVTVPSAHGPADIFPGEAIDAPPPFGRVINLLIKHDRERVLCVIFAILPGLSQPALLRTEAMGERRMAEIALLDRYRADLKRFVAMFNQMERTAKIGLWELRLDRRELRMSDEVKRIFSLPQQTVLAPSRALSFFPRPARRQLIEAAISARKTGRSASYSLPVLNPGGPDRTVRVFISRQTTGEGVTELAGVLQDVTEQQLATERLWWTANHDTLTELPNRALLADRLRKALARRARTRNIVCLILIDVDKFKSINDTFGHAAGDELLRQVAAQLRESVRSHDTVARTGGDEFTMLIEDVADMQALEAVFRRLRESLTVRFAWDANTVDVALSAGAAIAPHHGDTERELTGAADLALYHMKADPGASLALYEPLFGQAARDRNRLIAHARSALAAGKILPHYQPQVDIASGRIIGVEALARWERGEKVLSAADFGDALHDHDIGPMIGRAVVDRALVEIAQLNRGRRDKIALAINASSGELLRSKFLERIGKLSPSDPDRGPITVEVTEDVILDDPTGQLREQMRMAERDASVCFSLDDFGTGYGSLVHITSLPISEVKVDRRFVAGLESDPQKGKIVKGILDVARSLDVRVVLEGVETRTQVDLINKLGGRYVQGFYYSQAVPLEELTRLLDAQDRDAQQAA